MRNRERNNILNNQKGVTFLELMAAMAIVVIAAGGLTYSLGFLRTALRKSEAANLIVNVESTLVSSFNNADNYPDEPDPLRASLRDGSVGSITLSVPFAATPTTVSVSTGSKTEAYLDANLASCSGFTDKNCWIKYSVGFRKITTTSYPTYAFAYQLEVNPAISSMKKVGEIDQTEGSASSSEVPIDPANYRITDVRTKCDPATSMFMIGMNRDTGEALCVDKPSKACAKGTYPIGLMMSGTAVEMECTAAAKKAVCPSNYSLWSFDPKLTDPRCPDGIGCTGTSIGECIWTAKDSTSFPNSFPKPGIIKKHARGTFCPPYYFTNTLTLSTCKLRRGPAHRNGTCYSKIDNRNYNSKTCYASLCPTPGACTPPVPLPVGWVDPNNCGPSVPCSPYPCWDGVSKLNPAKGFDYSGNPVSVAPIDPALHFSGDGKRDLECFHDDPLPATSQPCQPGDGGDVDNLNVPAVWDSGIEIFGQCNLDPAVKLKQPAIAQ